LTDSILPPIGDAVAEFNEKRLFSQHQTAITLLANMVSSPLIKRLSWADLGCGPGQLMILLEDKIPALERAKIEFWPFDINPTYLNMIMTATGRLGFKSVTPTEGNLIKFDGLLPKGQLYNYITMINALHETSAVYIGDIIFNCIKRLTAFGQLYIYDVEKVIPPEHHAIAWKQDNVKMILECILGTLGEELYQPIVHQWNHSSRNGWSLFIQREYLGLSQDYLLDNQEKVIEVVRAKVIQILDWRLQRCKEDKDTLKKLNRYDALKPEDEQLILVEIEALDHALGKT
jgi:hypothetical protein